METRENTRGNEAPKVEEIYNVTKQWLSDINFYNDEVEFFKKLLEKYFPILIKKENIAKVYEINKELLEFETQKHGVRVHLLSLNEKAELVIKDLISEVEIDAKNNYFELTREIAELRESFREVKRSIFGLTEHIMEEEKLKHLLNP